MARGFVTVSRSMAAIPGSSSMAGNSPQREGKGRKNAEELFEDETIVTAGAGEGVVAEMEVCRCISRDQKKQRTKSRFLGFRKSSFFVGQKRVFVFHGNELGRVFEILETRAKYVDGRVGLGFGLDA